MKLKLIIASLVGIGAAMLTALGFNVMETNSKDKKERKR